MANAWLWPVSQENWPIAERNRVWATYSKVATDKIKTGDAIIFYIRGSGLLRNVYRIKSPWGESSELFWADERVAGKKLYPYQCSLELDTSGYAVYNELAPQLSFVLNKSNPQLYLKGTGGSPGNSGKPIPAEDLELIMKSMGQQIEEPKTSLPAAAAPEHASVISLLLELGSFLGFDATDEQDETFVAKGAVVDAVWIAKIANLGEIRYVFEVQVHGSIDSLLLNLIRATKNQTVQRVIAVAEEPVVEKIKREAETLPPDFKGKFLVWSITHVKELRDLVAVLQERKIKLGIGV